MADKVEEVAQWLCQRKVPDSPAGVVGLVVSQWQDASMLDVFRVVARAEQIRGTKHHEILKAGARIISPATTDDELREIEAFLAANDSTFKAD